MMERLRWCPLDVRLVIITSLLLLNSLAADPHLTLPTVVANPPPLPCHVDVTFDYSTNADWYAVIVRTNGVEVMRRYSMSNRITISNLTANLDAYQFTAIASNSLNGLISDETPPAVIRWCTVTELYSYDLTNWNLLTTNSFAPDTNHAYFRMQISNFNAAIFLKPD